MRITYELSRTDWARFLKQAQKRMKESSRSSLKLLLVNVAAWIPIGVAIAAYVETYRANPEISNDLATIGIAGVLGVVAVVASAVLRQSAHRSAAFSDKGLFLAKSIAEANAAGITVEARGITTVYPWSAFLDVSEDSENLYLFVDNAQALIIKRGEFNPEELDRIRGWLKR